MKLIITLLILALTGCGGGQAVAPVGRDNSTATTTQNKPAQSKSLTSYKVKKGDTLYSISWRYGMNYKTLAKINNIHSPYKIFVGETLKLKSSGAVAKTKTKTKTTIKPKVGTNSPAQKTTTKPIPTASTSNTKLSWRWPTKGKIVSTYSKSATGRKGIDIAGLSGQGVVAAASGKVVYSGNGLPRYGNLLIIKHNDVYLSAYAHNKTLLVAEGQHVKSGQKIALLGKTGTQNNQLHFEIRHNGKPVDPLRFLPK